MLKKPIKPIRDVPTAILIAGIVSAFVVRFWKQIAETVSAFASYLKCWIHL